MIYKINIKKQKVKKINIVCKPQQTLSRNELYLKIRYMFYQQFQESNNRNQQKEQKQHPLIKRNGSVLIYFKLFKIYKFKK